MRRPSRGAITFESFGVRARVTVQARELSDRVEALLPPGWQPCADAPDVEFGVHKSEPETYAVTIGDETRLEGAAPEVALALLDAQIRASIAAGAPNHIFVHAGVVARGDCALLIPGESFSGKTTLVAALVRAGAMYYSDEYAVLDDDGRVHPYPRPLKIRRDDAPPQHRNASELGAAVGRESATVSAVVVTRYRAGAQWQPTRISRGEAVLALLANTVPAQERPEESLRAIRRAATSAAMCLRSDRGEAETVTDSLLERLEQHGRDAPA